MATGSLINPILLQRLAEILQRSGGRGSSPATEPNAGTLAPNVTPGLTSPTINGPVPNIGMNNSPQSLSSWNLLKQGARYADMRTGRVHYKNDPETSGLPSAINSIQPSAPAVPVQPAPPPPMQAVSPPPVIAPGDQQATTPMPPTVNINGPGAGGAGAMAVPQTNPELADWRRRMDQMQYARQGQ